jgi:regulatory protein
MSLFRKKPADAPAPTPEQLRQKAMRLLARREHSQKQLQQKLSLRGAQDQASIEAIEGLSEDGYQSDARFGGSLIRQRLAQGFGPLRIVAELQQAGLGRSLIAELMDAEGPDWVAVCRDAHQRRSGGGRHSEDAAKHWRYLAQRGFTAAQIAQVVRKPDGGMPED